MTTNPRPPYFRVEIAAHGDRNSLIDQLKDTILAHQGSIMDFKMYSDLSLNLMVEVTQQNLLKIMVDLRNLGWRVKSEVDIAERSSNPDAPLEGTIQMTFAAGTGELKVIVPDVPG